MANEKEEKDKDNLQNTTQKTKDYSYILYLD